ncbi:hypothetical protein GCM10023215_67070 [Pseudonocardia yuanmonensis]|uniref:Uncharacterized protein n=1 Tax=Pseudonocardia yuanmonensis TaxID=1095914 RepID=A0ABP8XWP3_9PSEU
MFRRKSAGTGGRIARRTAVLAITAGAAFAAIAAPAQAETYTATCSPINPDSGVDGVNIEMLGVTLAEGWGVRLTLIMDQNGRQTELGQWKAEFGQPYWQQGGPANLPGTMLQGPQVSGTPGGLAASVTGSPVMLKAWYVVEYYQVGYQPTGAYVHPVKARNGSDWCQSA